MKNIGIEKNNLTHNWGDSCHDVYFAVQIKNPSICWAIQADISVHSSRGGDDGC